MSSGPTPTNRPISCRECVDVVLALWNTRAWIRNGDLKSRRADVEAALHRQKRWPAGGRGRQGRGNRAKKLRALLSALRLAPRKGQQPIEVSPSELVDLVAQTHDLLKRLPKGLQPRRKYLSAALTGLPKVPAEVQHVGNLVRGAIDADGQGSTLTAARAVVARVLGISKGTLETRCSPANVEHEREHNKLFIRAMNTLLEGGASTAVARSAKQQIKLTLFQAPANYLSRPGKASP